jgi:hypothetical protein
MRTGDVRKAVGSTYMRATKVKLRIEGENNDVEKFVEVPIEVFEKSIKKFKLSITNRSNLL